MAIGEGRKGPFEQLPDALKLSGTQNNQLHRTSDVDKSKEAQHHTLGPGPGQAAAGSDVAALKAKIAALEASIAALPASAMTKIGDFTNTGPSFQLNSIPQTFTHLKIRAVMRTQHAGAVVAGRIYFNGDTGANYNSAYGYVPSGHAADGLFNGSVGAFCGTCAGLGGEGGGYGFWDIDIPWYTYAGITKYGEASSTMMNTGNYMLRTLVTFRWNNIAAINSIFLADDAFATIEAPSKATLYGIK